MSHGYAESMGAPARINPEPVTVLDDESLHRLSDFINGLSDLVNQTTVSLDLSDVKLLIGGNQVPLRVVQVHNGEDETTYGLEVC